MALYAGYFFEGTYQLKKELTGESGGTAVRWLVDDFTGQQKERAVIEIFPYPFDDKLAWKGEVAGLKKIGQSAGAGYRYFVWEAAGGHLLPVGLDEIDDVVKGKYAQLIDSWSTSAKEEVVLPGAPEFWRSAAGEVLIFYRRQATQNPDLVAQQAILSSWKELLGATSFPVNRIPEEVPQKLASSRKTKLRSVVASVTAVRAALIGIGIVLAVVAYSLKPPEPVDDGKSREVFLAAFTVALENGTIYAKKGDYERAIEYFTTAANTPESDVSKARMDSLSKVYEAMGIAECQRYQATQNPELYFIPDQYFHYAYLLGGTAPQRKCE